jgi:hypothetical protein
MIAIYVLIDAAFSTMRHFHEKYLLIDLYKNYEKSRYEFCLPEDRLCVRYTVLYSKEQWFETYFVMFIVSQNIFEFALHHFR